MYCLVIEEEKEVKATSLQSKKDPCLAKKEEGKPGNERRSSVGRRG